MIQENPTDIFKRLASKNYVPLMNDGLDLLARTTINANGMRAKGENFGNAAYLIEHTLGAWDDLLYNAALVIHQPRRVAESLNAIPYKFIALSANARNFGNDYAQEVLAEELFAYGGALLDFPQNILGSLGDDPETVNDGIKREDTMLVVRGIGALIDAGLVGSQRFYDDNKDRLDERLVIPK